MSDYHVLAITNNDVQVAFHFTVPATSNKAGKTYKQCLLEDSAEPNTTVLADTNIDLTEKTAIENADVIERVDRVPFNINHTDADKRAAIETRHTELATELQTTLTGRYEFWGFSADVS